MPAIASPKKSRRFMIFTLPRRHSYPAISGGVLHRSKQRSLIVEDEDQVPVITESYLRRPGDKKGQAEGGTRGRRGSFFRDEFSFGVKEARHAEHG